MIDWAAKRFWSDVTVEQRGEDFDVTRGNTVPTLNGQPILILWVPVTSST